MARKSKLQVEAIDYKGVYPFRLIIVYRRKGIFKEMLKELSEEYPELEKGIDEMEDTIVAFTFCTGETGNIFLFLTEDFGVDVLVHECVHIASRAFEAIGSQFTYDTEEIYAYLLEYIFRETYKILTKKFKLKVKVLFEEEKINKHGV